MVTSSRRAVLAALVGSTSPLHARAAPAASPFLLKALEGGKTPGMAALVIRDGRAEPELVAGLRRMGGTEAVAPGDRWHLGSNGKAMTATLIARLVEQRRLAWDTPLEKLLPAAAGAMRPEYRDVTLPDLLSHRSGLPENHADMTVFNSFYADPAPLTAQRLRYVTVALGDAPVGPKRAAMSYSNTGLLIAAAAAEHATGKPFETLIVEQVFRPLGIRSVSFDQYGGPHEPCGHVDGRLADRTLDANPRMFAPAGAMRMTLPDWSRFCIDHLQDERGRGKLLQASTYRFLHAPQGDTASALGWGVQATAVGRQGPALTHSGSDGNWYALVLLFPQAGAGVLVAANAAESMGGNLAAVSALRVLAATVAAPAPPRPS